MPLVGLNKVDNNAVKQLQALKEQEESFAKAHAEYLKGRTIKQMEEAAKDVIAAEKAKLDEQKAKLVTLNNAILAKQAKVDNAIVDTEKAKVNAKELEAKAEHKLKEVEAELLKAKQKVADATEKEIEAEEAKKLYEAKKEDIKKTLRALV